MAMGHSLYGYLEGLTEFEPSALFAMVRNGSRYGLMDVLSLDSLGQADLDQYGALIVPMAFFLPDKAQATLNQFALMGGLLVADAGAGMYQANGTVGAIPEILRETFGLPEEAETEAPTKSAEERAAAGRNADLGRAQAEQDQEAMIRQLYSLLEAPDVSKTLGIDFGGKDTPGLRARKLGKGMVVYAPAFLYQQWRADRADFAQFHERVLGWRSDVRVTQPDQLWPSVEASASADGTVTVVTPGGLPAAVRRYGDIGRLFLVPNGAVRVWEAAAEPTELLFPGDPIATAEPLAMTLRPQDDGTSGTVLVLGYDANKVELEIHGTGAEANAPQGQVVLSKGNLAAMTLTLEDGAFPIRPGTSYRVVIEDRGRQTQDYQLMPDPEQKTLTVRNQFRSAHVTITPGGSAFSQHEDTKRSICGQETSSCPTRDGRAAGIPCASLREIPALQGGRRTVGVGVGI